MGPRSTIHLLTCSHFSTLSRALGYSPPEAESTGERISGSPHEVDTLEPASIEAGDGEIADTRASGGAPEATRKKRDRRRHKKSPVAR